MTKAGIFFFFSLLLYQDIFSQNNLVLNPSFEEYYDTSVIGIGSFRRGWVTDWSDPNFGSSDIFVPSYGYAAVPNNAFGFEYPHSGLCYAGMEVFIGDSSLHSSEYIQANFAHPLQNGRTYIIKTFVSLADYESSVCYSDLGFYMSDTQISIHSPYILPFSTSLENSTSNLLHVLEGWQLVTALYTAYGGEKYMSIGTFKPANLCNMDFCRGPVPDPGSQGVYLYIDDVSVIDTGLTDTINLCSNDSIMIGRQWRNTPGLYYDTLYGIPIASLIQYTPFEASITHVDKHFLSGDSVSVCLLQTSDSLVEGNFIWVKNDTTIDVPMYTIHGCDSVVYYHCRTNDTMDTLCIGNGYFELFPNPAKDLLKIKMKNKELLSLNFQILDVLGRVVLSPALQNCELDISVLRNGLYFVKLYDSKSGKVMAIKKFVKE